MLNLSYLESIAERLASAVPQSARNLQEEIQAKFKVILQSALSDLNLVTQERFNAQTKVLARTRTLIAQLEKRVTELEALLASEDKKS